MQEHKVRSRDELRSMVANSSMVSTLNDSRIATARSGKAKWSAGKATPATAGGETGMPDLNLNMEELEAAGRLNVTCPLWNQSSSTWRYTSPRYSFSKDSRFKADKASHLDIQQLELPSSLRSKSCTFGKGSRCPISVVTMRNAKLTPSPDRYNLDEYLEEPRSPEKGKTFGLPWSAYKKVYIKHRKDAYAEHFTENNPPAIYNGTCCAYSVREQPGKDKKKFSAYGRLKMFTQQMAEITRMNPGAAHEINEILVKQTVGLNERNFGFG